MHYCLAYTLMRSTVALVVQWFYAWRLWVISGHICLPVVIILVTSFSPRPKLVCLTHLPQLSLFQGASGIYAAVIALRFGSVFREERETLLSSHCVRFLVDSDLRFSIVSPRCG